MCKRIFIGPHEIAGYYSNLTKALVQIGVNCEFVTYSDHKFCYEGANNRPILLKLALIFSKLKYKSNNYFIKSFYFLISDFLRVIWSPYAILKYDVFIFGFGRSLLRGNYDLPIIKLLGKRIIVNLSHGAESRPSFLDGGYINGKVNKHSVQLLRKINARNKRLVIFAFKYASAIIGFPHSTYYFASNHFINSQHLGIPFYTPVNLLNSSSKYQSEDTKRNKPVYIIHCPSNPSAKGSNKIIEAISKLKKKGYNIKFSLISGKTNNEVIEEIKKCDFAVDQIYSDAPMPGFSTECSWFSKPVIVGGYGLDKLKDYCSHEFWPPTKICHPDSITDAIEELIVNVDLRLKIGSDSYEFVLKTWSPENVAKRFLKIINNDYPSEWLIDPSDIYYLEGAGQSIELTKKVVYKMVKRYGLKSLQLSHRPELEKAFMDFAYNQDK